MGYTLAMPTLEFGIFNGRVGRVITTGDIVLKEMFDNPDETYPRHTHEDVHFQVILRGRYKTGAIGADGLCGPQTIIFNPAGTTHDDGFPARDGRFVTLSLKAAAAQRLCCLGTCPKRATAFTRGELVVTFSKLLRELRDPDCFSSTVVEGLTLEIFAQFLRTTRQVNISRPLMQAVEVINSCLDRKLTVSDIAAMIGISAPYLGRGFQQHFGCSIGEMVRMQRVYKARDMLLGGKIPLAEIAIRTGFSDQAQFSKAFRRVTGFSPGDFRRLFCPAAHKFRQIRQN
jgi:AraC family transcriptional regulator